LTNANLTLSNTWGRNQSL